MSLVSSTSSIEGNCILDDGSSFILSPTHKIKYTVIGDVGMWLLVSRKCSCHYLSDYLEKLRHYCQTHRTHGLLILFRQRLSLGLDVVSSPAAVASTDIFPQPRQVWMGAKFNARTAFVNPSVSYLNNVIQGGLKTDHGMLNKQS